MSVKKQAESASHVSKLDARFSKKEKARLKALHQSLDNFNSDLKKHHPRMMKYASLILIWELDKR